MSVNNLDTSYSALRANQFRVDVAANNVANINTDGFRASTVSTSDNAYINDIGTGTRVTGAYAPPRPGPPTTEAAASGPGQGTAVAEQSNTDAANEMINMRMAQNAYGANASMYLTGDDMTQTILDLRR